MVDSLNRSTTTYHVQQERASSVLYPEIVGMVIFIRGKALGGLDGVARGCLGAFSVGAGEEVLGRFDDCPTEAVALPRPCAGSCVSLDRFSVRGSSSSSSSSSLESASSLPSPPPSDSHSSGSTSLSPPLASPSTVRSCAPLGVEYISVISWEATNKGKVSRLSQKIKHRRSVGEKYSYL